MSFIKRGDGKIVDILETEELTDEQKETVQKNKELVKKTDSSKKLGN